MEYDVKERKPKDVLIFEAKVRKYKKLKNELVLIHDYDECAKHQLKMEILHDEIDAQRVELYSAYGDQFAACECTKFSR